VGLSSNVAQAIRSSSPNPFVIGSGTGIELPNALEDGWSMDTQEGVLMHACLTGAWRFMFLPKDHGYVCPGCKMGMPEHIEFMARVMLHEDDDT